MGDGSKIEWTDATWNPIVGCSKVGEGCENCYAIGVAHRGMAPQHRGLTIRVRNGDRETTEWNGTINVAPESVLTQPLRWKRPRRIFVNSLSDLFHHEVTNETIARIFAVMALAPQHTFQVLTKRPQRMALLLNSDEFSAQVGSWILAMSPSTAATEAAWVWPLPNVWLGVSIESNKYAWRADHLRSTPAAVRWVSAEPLLGPLDQLDLTGIDWVVAGGESGPGARPMHPAWVRDLRDACMFEGRGQCPTCGGSGSVPVDGGGAACGGCYIDSYGGSGRQPVPFLFKQWGSWVPGVDVGEGRPFGLQNVFEERILHGDGSVCGHDACGAWTPMVRVPSKSLRLLDGRTWDEYPEGAAL